MDFSCKGCSRIKQTNTPSKLTIIGPKDIPEKYKKLNYLNFISFLDKNNNKNTHLLSSSF